MSITSEICLEESTNELIIGSSVRTTRIKLDNQLFQVLKMMVENRGDLVSRQAFIEKVWQGNIYSGESALAKNIFRLREFLKNEELGGQLEIETIPKKGYRLIVKEIHSVNKKNHFRKLIPSAVIVSLLMGFLLLRYQPVKENTTKYTIAGKDTVIHLGNKPVMVIDLDTVKDPVLLVSLKD